MKNYHFLNLIAESWKVYKRAKLFEETIASSFMKITSGRLVSWSSKLRNKYLILGLLFHYNNCIQHQTISIETDFALFNTCVKFVFFLISGSIWHTPDYIKQTLTCIPSE